MNDQENLKTNVRGYFNPNTYSIRLAISECNLSITLRPREFILDRRTGKKINDPLLDRYVGPRMLQPELVEAPVDILQLPRIVLPQVSEAGYVVGQGVKDAKGQWQPPATSSSPPAQVLTQSGAPVISTQTCIKGMSVEEARRQGLIGKPKLVPEDYGAPETDGAPVEGAKIPRMRYSMESKPKALAAQSTAIPAEWREGMDPKVAPILKRLEEASAVDLESANLDQSAAENAVLAQQGSQGLDQFRKQKSEVATPAPVTKASVKAPPASAPAPKPKRVAQVVATPEPQVKQPAVAAIATPGPVPVSPIVGGRPDDMPEPTLDDGPSQKVAPSERDAMPIRCGACGKEFKFNSWYTRHVMKQHRDRLAELLPMKDVVSGDGL
jgi:hypothetical protein